MGAVEPADADVGEARVQRDRSYVGTGTPRAAMASRLAVGELERRTDPPPKPWFCTINQINQYDKHWIVLICS